jgi:hypothetical protein
MRATFQACLRVAACACALLWPACGNAQPAGEYEAKAAFIYNIALFTSFPNADAGTLRLCVLGRDPFDGALNALAGKAVGSLRLAVAFPRSSSEAMKRCQILYISDSEADSMAALADAGRDASVLTIAGTRGAARQGVMLELCVQDKKIGFEFNGASARSANISLSSKVLRLAKAVY